MQPRGAPGVASPRAAEYDAGEAHVPADAGGVRTGRDSPGHRTAGSELDVAQPEQPHRGTGVERDGVTGKRTGPYVGVGSWSPDLR